jgi:hypothetical protein
MQWGEEAEFKFKLAQNIAKVKYIYSKSYKKNIFNRE